MNEHLGEYRLYSYGNKETDYVVLKPLTAKQKEMVAKIRESEKTKVLRIVAPYALTIPNFILRMDVPTNYTMVGYVSGVMGSDSRTADYNTALKMYNHY